MERAIIISPYAGNIEANLRYLDRCLKYAIDSGYAPFAGHAYLPRVLVDSDPEARRLGMRIASIWFEVADKALCFEDFGISTGMKADLAEAYYRLLPIKSYTILSSEERNAWYS